MMALVLLGLGWIETSTPSLATGPPPWVALAVSVAACCVSVAAVFVARKSAVEARRPWVGVSLDLAPTEAQPWTLVVKAKNTGQTPALFLRLNCNFRHAVDEPKAIHGPDGRYGLVLPPGAEHEEETFPDHDVAALPADGKLWLWGAVRYEDASGDEHETCFRAFIVPKDQGGFMVRYAIHGNTAT